MKRNLKLFGYEQRATLHELFEAINGLANGDSMHQARHYFLIYKSKGGPFSFREITGKSIYSKNASEMK